MSADGLQPNFNQLVNVQHIVLVGKWFNYEYHTMQHSRGHEIVGKMYKEK